MGETMVRDGIMNYEKIIRDVCRDVGYDNNQKGLDCENMTVVVNVVPQSKEIFDAVHKKKYENVEGFGAGDQGLMFGYATDEWDTEKLTPYSHYLANALCEELGKARHSGEIPWLRPDCKS